MKKWGLASLAVLLALALSSCGVITINRPGQTTDPAGTDGTDITVPSWESKDYPTMPEEDYSGMAKKKTDSLPAADLAGRAVIFAVASETGDIFNAESETYSQAALYRDSLVAGKYNAKVISLFSSAAQLLSDVKAADKSGDYYADFAVIRSGDVPAYHSGGYLRNLKSLLFTELDDECYDSRAAAQLTVGGVIIGTAGWAVRQPENYGCLYLNLTFGEKYGIKPDYGTLVSGGFTWDVLFESMKLMPEEGIRFVSRDDVSPLVTGLFFSTGQNYLSNSDGYALACRNDITEKFVSDMKTLLSMRTGSIKKNITVADESGVESEKEVTLTGTDIFLTGEALVLSGTLGTMKEIKNCGFMWEALPLPKTDEAQEKYSTLLSSDAPVITALASADNPESAGYVLRAVNTASYGYIERCFFAEAESEYITGVHTLDMMELICQDPVYDHAAMFGASSKNLRNGTYNAVVSAVTGTKSLKNCLDAAKASLNAYIGSLS